MLETRLSNADERRAKATRTVDNFEEVVAEAMKLWNTHKSELTAEFANRDAEVKEANSSLTQLRQTLAGRDRSEQDEQNGTANQFRRQQCGLELDREELQPAKIDFEK